MVAVDPKPISPGPSQPLGPPDVDSSISSPLIFQLPFSAGQPWPSSVNVPPGSNRATKAPNFNGWRWNLHVGLLACGRWS